MMKKYILPEIKFDILTIEDVLTSSGLTAVTGEQIFNASEFNLFK